MVEILNKLRILFAVSSFSLMAAILVAYFAFINTSHVIVVHFDVLKGIDYLGTRNDVFGIGLVAFAMNLVNAALARFLYQREKFLAYAFATANVMFMALVLAAIITIAVNNA